METSRISLNQIEVDTATYRWNLGREPKGKGQWYFAIGNRREAMDDITKAFATGYMYYTDAVKVAKREAQKKGVTTIYVLP